MVLGEGVKVSIFGRLVASGRRVQPGQTSSMSKLTAPRPVLTGSSAGLMLDPVVQILTGQELPSEYDTK